jgi:hypothetical protein
VDQWTRQKESYLCAVANQSVECALAIIARPHPLATFQRRPLHKGRCAKLHFLVPSVPACLIVRSSESTLIMTATSFRRKNCFRLVLCSAIKMTAAW